MSYIKIERFAYTPFGTFGRLEYDSNKYFTIERPWEDNKKSVSCIPEGRYKVVWYASPTFGRTLAVIGGTVSLFDDPKFQRSAILFHLANTMDDLRGCIGLGRSLGYINKKWAIVSSDKSVKEFLSLGIKDNTDLIISQYLPS
jgi:hypothetical protein